MNKLDDLYLFIEKHANENELPNTKITLPLAKKLLGDIKRQTFRTYDNNSTSFEHSLSAAKMLIDLHIILSKEEEDIMLSSMLLHDLLVKIKLPENGNELISTYHLDSRILGIIKLVPRIETMTDKEKVFYYNGIRENKIAVLVALADRCNLVEQLSELSISDVNEFVQEMRRFVLPMSAYAKQHYRDCQMSINIMTEKIHCLIDVTDIIASRYQKRELSYTNEILSIMEENARLRGMIRQLEAGEI